MEINKEKQLVKNTIIVAIGKISTQFISFILLPLYTTILSTEEYGVVDLLNTYITLLMPIIFLQTDQAIFRFLIDVRDKEKEKKELISTTLIFVTFQSIIYIIIYCIIAKFIINEYKYFLATNLVVAMFSNILLQISRGTGNNVTYSLGSLVSGLGAIVLNILFITIFKWGAYGMLTATLLANVICSIFVFFKEKMYKFVNFNSFSKMTLWKMLKYAIPLIPNMLSWWIINASDRTIVTFFLGIESNGIYSVANKFSSICIAIFNIFNMTWSESTSMYIKDKNRDIYFSNVTNKAIIIFSSVCISIIVIIPFIFDLIINNNFCEAYYQIPILMASTIFSIIVSLLGSFYVALKKSKEIAKTSIYAAIINISINIILINKIGLYAASISTFISYFVMAIYRYLDVRKYIAIKLDKKSLVSICIILILIFPIYYARNIYLCLLGTSITIILLFLLNKDIIKFGYSFLKSKFIKNQLYNERKN